MKPKRLPEFRFSRRERYQDAGVRRMRRHMFGPETHKPFQELDESPSAPGGQPTTLPDRRVPEPG